MMTEKKVAIETYYVYADAKYSWHSTEHFEEQEDATDACIDRMREEKTQGYKVHPCAIIRVDHERVYDEFVVIKEQTTKTTVELISKQVVEE